MLYLLGLVLLDKQKKEEARQVGGGVGGGGQGLARLTGKHSRLCALASQPGSLREPSSRLQPRRVWALLGAACRRSQRP